VSDREHPAAPPDGGGRANRYIEPAAYQPPSTKRRGIPLRGLAVMLGTAGVLAVGATLWFVLTMRAVELRITPEPESVRVSGLTFPMGENWLARPGTYNVTAARPGFHELSETITVPASGPARFELTLEPLPGRVSFTGTPKQAVVRIDGEKIGEAPLEEYALPGGEYQLEIARAGFLTESRQLEVQGRDVHQKVEFELTPSTAQVEISSSPPDAEIRVNGESLGRTPATVELDAGRQEVALVKSGYRTWHETIEIEGGEDRSLPPVALEPAAAALTIESDPSGAAVRINGETRGRAPVEAELPPDEPATIELSMAGFETLSRTITPRAGVERTLRGELLPIPARLFIQSDPAGAEVLINGSPAGRTGADGLSLELPAREYEVELRREGFATATETVRLDPDRPTRLEIDLMTDLEARMSRVQPLIWAADGQTLQLVRPGTFTMGSPRGQQGRRANETQREVTLSRLFYMGLHEVTNEQFRRFRPDHSSGIVGDFTLDNEEQPVVRISFEDAAAFCNWLSERDGLEPAYRRARGGYELKQPVTRGYRLPSEAEWAWVARFAGDRNLKYPWGEGMPPPPGAGNYADQSAADLLPTTLPGYDDGKPASALVGSFAPNALGFHDLGGNVSEWLTDGYRIRLNETPEAETDPIEPAADAERVVRGSSWRHAGITELRLAWRDRATEGRDDLGFRVVRYAE